jgi:hypothetical protein
MSRLNRELSLREFGVNENVLEVINAGEEEEGWKQGKQASKQFFKSEMS